MKDAAVIASRARGLQLVLFAAAQGLVASCAQAADARGVSDPTRPPPGVYRPVGAPTGQGQSAPHAPSAQAVATAASAAPVASTPSPAPMRLQGIRHNGASGGGVALIDGQLVELGGKVSGSWTLSAMSSDEVWLSGPGGQRRLTLVGGDTQTDKPRAATGRKARKE